MVGSPLLVMPSTPPLLHRSVDSGDNVTEFWVYFTNRSMQKGAAEARRLPRDCDGRDGLIGQLCLERYVALQCRAEEGFRGDDVAVHEVEQCWAVAKLLHAPHTGTKWAVSLSW